MIRYNTGMPRLDELEERVQKIETRNRSVELNKSWETSYTRRILLVIFTYLAIALYLKFIIGINPWVTAVVPTIGFLLSTLTLPYFKKLWERYIHKK
jgi:sterol desaturase/sphingolipid hydroxylase (fatty acid hydroxylase superfamily)